MSGLNRDVLISNIRELMDQNNVTQKKLAEALGMSQPNVNHALNPNGTKYFTLEQVVAIAEFFKTSVDALIGNHRARYIETSPKATADFIAKLLETHRGLLTPVQIEEDRFIVDYENGYLGAAHTRETGEYLCLYLPNYWPLPENDPIGEVSTEYFNCGNDTCMVDVNIFLKQFKEIFSIYEKGGLSEETYTTVLQDLLSHLNDK